MHASENSTPRQNTIFPGRPNILQALTDINFTYHRICSLTNLLQECNALNQTLLVFWGSEESESLSLSPSSCTSLLMAANSQNPKQHETEVRSTEQQTDISCRYTPGLGSPGSEDPRTFRAHLAESLTFASPASPQPAGRSLSILGSVCALLLTKQASRTKEVSNVDVSSSQICRICFGGESAARLVRPCGCRGTVAAVHRACLERWLLQASTSYCELCRHHYTVTRSHKWSFARSVWEWVWSERGRALAADAWRGALLGAASVLGTARALHVADAALQAGALNGLLTTWILLKIQEHQASWRAWRDSTVHVRVALDDATPPRTPSAAPSATHSGDSFVTVCNAPDATVERATNIADPFMVSLPYILPDP